MPDLLPDGGRDLRVGVLAVAVEALPTLRWGGPVPFTDEGGVTFVAEVLRE